MAKSMPNLQYAALPYRRSEDGLIEVMLVTSRGTMRWIVPKGWPIPGKTPYESAAQEALEEGGLVGEISERPVGKYQYQKRTEDRGITCTVEVFLMKVEGQLSSWPEQDQRSTAWFGLEKAAQVLEPGLARILRDLPSMLDRETRLGR